MLLALSKHTLDEIYNKNKAKLCEIRIRLAGAEVGLLHVIDHPRGSELFHAYLAKEHAEENLLFYRAVDKFDAMCRAIAAQYIQAVKMQEEFLLTSAAGATGAAGGAAGGVGAGASGVSVRQSMLLQQPQQQGSTPEGGSTGSGTGAGADNAGGIGGGGGGGGGEVGNTGTGTNTASTLLVHLQQEDDRHPRSTSASNSTVHSHNHQHTLEQSSTLVNTTSNSTNSAHSATTGTVASSVFYASSTADHLQFPQQQHPQHQQQQQQQEHEKPFN